MNNTDKTGLPGLDGQIRHLINSEDLGSQLTYLKNLVEKSDFDLMECAAALLFLLQNQSATQNPSSFLIRTQEATVHREAVPQTIKMIRYRLDVGRQHHITAEGLKKVLVEESGVDKNNILNIDIQDLYTLIELPDEMPTDIFQHLKSVEINRQKLDIRRVKNRRIKKRGNHRYGRHRQHSAKNQSEPTGFSSKN